MSLRPAVTAHEYQKDDPARKTTCGILLTPQPTSTVNVILEHHLP